MVGKVSLEFLMGGYWRATGAEARERGQGKIWRDFGYQSK